MPKPRRDWWVVVGMAITAAAAAVSSFTGLRALAEATGWPGTLAPLLPLTIDAYAATATRVWLARTTRSARARRFARWNAVGAIALSLAGNACWHLIAAHVLAVSWLLIVAVGAVPPAVLGLLSHLAVLRGQDEAEPASTSNPASPDHGDSGRTETAPKAVPSRTEAELLETARQADTAYRTAHGGRPITRDALRAQLRIGGPRASALFQRLKDERNDPRNTPSYPQKTT